MDASKHRATMVGPGLKTPGHGNNASPRSRTNLAT